MKKQIDVALTDEAKEFVKHLPPAVRKKVATAFEKTENGHQGDWFKKLSSTEDLWEFRIDGPNHTYRLFAFWDSRSETETLVVCTHGLDKKTQKTPKADIAKAERIRRAYFDS
ncbi:MAG TPA: type II toxin-antitoxin system RelE/ParE family toxin [Hymenobacter sp.]|jgi:phage-related protein|uniref:type II toxin-antitoxin system RelE/ParE family toxin n=1 Tax=Hymenobacter sp. TaxID=1898978 RepID=UPI002EDA7142